MAPNLKWECVIFLLLLPSYFKAHVLIEHNIILNNNIIPTSKPNCFMSFVLKLKME